jgi:phosphinothricin acetyltransferase
LVAEMNDDVIGCASSYRARIGYRLVAHAMKSRGIGRSLLNTLIATYEARGCQQMIAVIGDGENAGSIKLHQACGFQHAALFKSIGYKFDRWPDRVQMVRALGAGSESPPD